MTRHISLFFFFICFAITAQIKSPSEFLGYDIGTQFSRHADVVNYFNHVAQNSEMVNYKNYGRTNERRPLTYAIVSSPQNIANIDNVRRDNLKNIGLENGDSNPQIAIVWLSYNVHGDEASSTEAAMLTLYKLVTEKQSWLENTVVIMDPCVNPDGRDRYANWYNQVKSTPYDISQVAAEHNQPWPGGRANHYLFDLNRDWVWATQVESEQRLKIYNQWMPHVHVDFHEQGINSPYYFAPAAKPYHEIITPWQNEFQTKIGKNHAQYFDKEGWLFFTREFFDLLYPSYGDTYPTFMGAIGMTYEQAGHGRAGLGVQTDEGYVLTLVDRVAHHTTTGLSTVETSSKNASKLNSEFKKFFQNSGLKYKSYVLKGNSDKIHALTQLLRKHEIKYGFSSGGNVSGYNYATDGFGSMDSSEALVVSTNQPKGKMVKVLFEPNTKLSTPLTYDITAWSIPHAYGLDAIASTNLVTANRELMVQGSSNSPSLNSPGYISKWNSIYDATFLAELLKNNIRVRFSEKDLSFSGNTFNKGSLVLTRSDNKMNSEFDKVVTDLANKHNRQLYASSTSFSDNGTDFGSSNVKLINNQSIAVLKGNGIGYTSYGAIWHFFEKQLQYPVTSIDVENFNANKLAAFDVLILPEGRYGRALNDDALDELKSWIRDGGKVIAIGRAVAAFEGKDGFDLTKNDDDDEEGDGDDTSDNLVRYEDREMERVKDFNSGSIFKVSIDNSHPLAFGYHDEYFSLKLGSNSYKFLEKGFNVGYIKDDAKSVAGFSGINAKEGLNNSLVFGEARLGRGSVIYLVDDILFRSFWENGKLFFVNSVFFVNNNKFRI